MHRASFAISTSWAAAGPGGVLDVARRALAVGAAAVELDHRVREAEFAPLVHNVRAAGLAIAALHDLCPLPAAFDGRAPAALPALGALDAEERLRAVRFTLRTVRLAADAGARAVVLRLGGVLDPPDAALRALLDGDGASADAVRAAVRCFLAARAERAPAHLEAARRSLEIVHREAARLGVRLGLKIRVGLHEIPDEEELAALLRDLAGGVAGYWHDTGHARVRARRGLGTQTGWIERFGATLAGLHLSDVRGGRDPVPPGTGEVDFRAVAAALPRDARPVLTVELLPHFGEDEVRAALDHLRAAGFTRRAQGA
jgi:sugar phosphate isomerase/epimerase